MKTSLQSHKLQESPPDQGKTLTHESTRLTDKTLEVSKKRKREKK